MGVHDHDVEHAVARQVLVDERDVELQLREVDGEHPHALGLDGLPVDGERDAGELRREVGEGRREVGHGAQKALGGLRALHDGGVVAGSRDHGESEALAVGELDLPDVEIHEALLAHEMGECVGLGR